jgi:hypothetical protein
MVLELVADAIAEKNRDALLQQLFQSTSGLWDSVTVSFEE